MKELKRYFSYIGKYKAAYWSVFIMTLFTSVILNLLYPYMNKLIFNAIEYKNSRMLKQAVIICVVLVLLNCLAPYRRYFQIRIVRKIVFDIKVRLFEKLMRMDISYYEEHHSGEALKILNWDANSLKDSYFSHVFWVTGRLVNGVTAITAMLFYSPILMLVSVCFCLVTVYISVRMNEKMKEMDKEIQNRISGLTMRLSDILSGFTELKMYRGASIVSNHFYDENDKVLQDEGARANTAAGLEMVAFLMGILASFGTIGVGAYLVACGQLDYGTVMAIVSLQMGVSTMVQGFGSALGTFTASLVKAGRVFDFLEMDYKESAYEARYEVWQETPEGIAPIDIEDITFSYGGQGAVLEQFSLCLEPGERVLLMGESGCGKSTLLKLIMGFYKEEQGNIRLYGQKTEDYSYVQLQQLVTYIPQRSYLIAGTIRDNIVIGGMGRQVTEEEVRRAAELAYADEFIRQLPMGYDTRLDAGGSNLSVGQRQRIAIARAFLKDAPILLMDEPSSALDVHSEKMINRALGELMKDKAVIMVTHRSNLFDGFHRVVNL